MMKLNTNWFRVITITLLLLLLKFIALPMLPWIFVFIILGINVAWFLTQIIWLFVLVISNRRY